jgi:outer membrane protein TolC
MGRIFIHVVVLVSVSLGAVAQEAVPLTLADAAKMALANNPMHKAALADTRVALAGVREARAPMLPRIMFEENYTRGNDPVFVFGAKLRQQVFSAQDLELNSLNRPTPFGNYASRFSGQWKLFDSTQSWKALDRAKFMNVAAEQQLNRTDQELVFQTVQAFAARRQ